MLEGTSSTTSIGTSVDKQPAVTTLQVRKYNGTGYATVRSFG